MATIRLYMAMSLDGFVCGPDDRPGQELGQGGGRLFNWLDQRDGEGVDGHVYGEARATAAVITGRRTFELAGRWGGDHHDGVPIFILTRHDPADLRQWPLVSYVNDVTTAMTQAKEAAGDKNVLVHGAGTAQLALAADVLDELELHFRAALAAGRLGGQMLG